MHQNSVLQRLAPWLSNYDDSLTPASPRVSWLPFALNNKVLFMATLLSAAVHLDRLQPVGDQRKILWYKVETMRLANETLTDPAEGASDPMIIVALILLYFNVSSTSIPAAHKADVFPRLEEGTQTNMRYTSKEFIKCSSSEAAWQN